MARFPPNSAAIPPALLDGLSCMGAQQPRLDRYVAQLSQKTLFQQLATDDMTIYDSLTWIGDFVHHGLMCFCFGRLHPYQTREWYSTAQHALGAAHMRTFIFCRAGAFQGHVQSGTTSIANLFNAFIGAFWVEKGWDASLDMIIDIYQDAFSAVVQALLPLSCESAPVDDPSAAEQNLAIDLSPVHKAVIKALYAIPSSVFEQFDLSSLDSPSLEHEYMMALGIEYVRILTAVAIRRECADISIQMLETLFNDIFDHQVLDHVARRLGSGRTLPQEDHVLVYLWLGQLVKARDQPVLEIFVRMVIIPMSATARAMRYPLYYPQARLSKDPFLPLNVNSARQQLVVYWCELNYFDFYQPVVSSETVYNNAPDLAGFVAAGGPIEDLATSVQAFEGKHLLAPEQPDDLTFEQSGAPTAFSHIIARGFDAANTRQLIRLVTAFAKHLPVSAEFFRLLATDREPNGGAILRIRASDQWTLLRGKDEAPDPFKFEGSDIFLITERAVLQERFAQQRQEVSKLRKGMQRYVRRGTFTIRGMDHYRTLLTEAEDPMCRGTAGGKTLELFGRNMMVFRRDDDNRGCVKSTSIPYVPRCGIQFRPRRGRLPAYEIELMFDEEDRASVQDYEMWVEKDMLMIICSVSLSQPFVDNLNAVRSRLRGVDGVWGFIPQAELPRHMLRIANRKASAILLPPA